MDARLAMSALAVTLAAALSAQTASGAGSVTNPLAGRPLAANADDQLTRAAGAEEDPAARELLGRLAAQPQARWVTGWASLAGTGHYLERARRERATPVVVLYAIPGRDCGSHSGGGAASASGYRRLVGALAGRLAGSGAAVILEPDALSLTWCLSARRLAERERLLASATRRLSRAGAAVYLDAGHAGWIPASLMAERLLRSGVARASGVALNVSYTSWSSSERRFGRLLSRRLHHRLGRGLRVVIDTSRNGAGPALAWCNPAGRAVGATPRVLRSDALVDAYLWVKRPGESDGTCAGGPPAGVLSRADALAYARTLGGAGPRRR